MSVVPVFQARKGSGSQTRSWKGRSFRAGGEQVRHPWLAASHLAGEPGHRLHSGTGDVGPSVSAGAQPHTQTPKGFTLFPTGSPSDLARQRLEGPGNSASAVQVRGCDDPRSAVTAVAVTRRPPGSWERKTRPQSSG